MIPVFLKEGVERVLGDFLHSTIKITGSKTVSGGCINHCFKLSTHSGNYFLKFNDADRYPKMFEAEAAGLNLIRGSDSVGVPGVMAIGVVKDLSFLLLEWIEPARRNKNFWEDFGMRLARLHSSTSSHFGLKINNYIGSLPQSNRPHQNWAEFFIHERLEPQLKLARDSGAITQTMAKQMGNLYPKLNSLVPPEPPSLLHGDLWGGNFLTGPSGSAILADPAVYYGHREADLAMTKLFGGFSPEFYEAYNSVFPLCSGYEERTDIHNLYPLLVHVNLFGGGYLHQVQSILSKFA